MSIFGQLVFTLLTQALRQCTLAFLILLQLLETIRAEIESEIDGFTKDATDVSAVAAGDDSRNASTNTSASLPLVESSWRHEKQLQTRVLAMGIALPVGLVLVLTAIYFVFEKKLHRSPWTAVRSGPGPEGEAATVAVIENIQSGNESLYA